MDRYYYRKPLDIIKSGLAGINTAAKKILAGRKRHGKSSAEEMVTKPSDVSIRIKFITIVVISILISMGISTYFSGKTVASKIEEAERTRLFNALDSTIYQIKDYQKKAVDNASILSNSAELRQYCVDGNNVSASQFLVRLSGEIGLDFAMVADKDKRLLSRTDQPLKSGDDLSEDYMIRSGFAGFKNIKMYPSEKGLVIQSVSPIQSGVAAKGVVTVGAIMTQYNIGGCFLENIKDTYGVEAILYSKEYIITTFNDEKTVGNEKLNTELRIDSNIRKTLDMKKENLIEKKSIGGRFYNVAYKPIKNNKAEIVGILAVATPQDGVAAAKKSVQFHILLVGLTGILLAVIFTAIASRRILAPINRLVKDTNVIAEGNLRYRSVVAGRDEVGQLAVEFNRMADSLRGLICQVLQTVDTTNSSSENLVQFVKDVREISEEMEVVSERIRNGAQEQFGCLELTKDEMDNVYLAAEEIFNRTAEIVKHTDAARLAFEKETGELKHLSNNMNITKETIISTVTRIEDFKLNLQQIKKAVEIITAIASQTRLLALNAAIEAARAGESGKGFGVVAEEVRKLSDESSKSIVVIKDIMKALFAEMDDTVGAVRESTGRFEQCIAIANSAEYSFGEIVNSFGEIKEMIADIAGKADLQASNIDRVTNIIIGVSRIAQSSQEQSELMHEGALKQSKYLGGFIEEFGGLTSNIGAIYAAVEKFDV